MAVEFFIHKMSEHMETAQILKWLVKEGDRVEKFQVIMEVMTDKVTAELEAPVAGVVRGIRPGAIDGATVPVGEPICYIAAADETVPVLPPLPTYVALAESTAAPAEETQGVSEELRETESKTNDIRATPVARRVARELGIDIAAVTGTGPQGRITETDVRNYIKTSTTPTVAVTAVGVPPSSPEPSTVPVEWLTLTPIQRITGDRMRESVLNAPQFALEVDVDMSAALWLREQIVERVAAEAGEKLSITGLLVKVVAAALRRHPAANAEFVEGRLKVHGEINVGVAVGTNGGLAVPVIKGADRKALAEITRELGSFQGKAGTLRFSADDLSGGTFTISNLGMFGVDRFRAIVNPPQSAILAVGRIIRTPVGLPDDTIALRPVMSLTLTVDHRCMDGIQAAHFLTEIKELLEKPHLLLA